MNRIDKKFTELKTSGKKAVSVFLTAGFPNLEATDQLVSGLAESGVDIFEIGFPFSDPIADGPTIQKSSEAALSGGMTWNKLMHTVRKIRAKTEVPLVLMTYANAMLCRGWKRSALEMARAGFDGVIVPDLIPEEASEIEKEFHRVGLHLIYLLAPTSSDKRIRKAAQKSSGFIYCVSVTGVTGTRAVLPKTEIKAFLRRVRKHSPVPVLLGFGISTPGHIHAFRDCADGFIIGSALIQLLENQKTSSSLIKEAKNFILPFIRVCKAR